MAELRMTMKAWRRLLAVASLALFLVLSHDMLSSGRKLTVLRKPSTYNYFHVSETASHSVGFHSHMLVFNGKNFEVYNLDKKGTVFIAQACSRCTKAVPLLVHALKQLNPSRFEPGQPVFQLMFSSGDSASMDCNNIEGGCDFDHFAPMMLFGSAPVESSEMPKTYGFPNWFFMSCLYDYKMKGSKQCHWNEPIEDPQPFESLQNTLIWRGSDYCFLPEREEFRFKGAAPINLAGATTAEVVVMKLTEHLPDLSPRWRAIVMTAQAELHNETWIDAKFAGSSNAELHALYAARGVNVRSTKKMTPTDMAKYKYQIDFGGGGGTSWRGTMTKLGFPGVLFHHQTPTKDWFYDEMQPWVHYIPVTWHLGDLKEKYHWAMAHEEAARKIANKASELFNYLMSEAYMKKVYNELFVDYLKEIMQAHRDPVVPWSEIKRSYEGSGFELDRVSVCDETSCTTVGLNMNTEKASYVPEIG